MTNNFPKRRVFITDGGKYYKIFSFTQEKSDGSIYVSSPNFSEIKWLAISANQDPSLSIIDSPGDGKLSLHASGVAGIRVHEIPHSHKLVIRGNYLLDYNNNRVGIRHLFTIFMAEPKELPASPAFNRLSDYSINKTGKLSPFVMVFFAIPRMPDLKVTINASFDIDDLESIPPDLGFGLIDLEYHTLAWLAYKTKHMNKWPKHSHMCYHDGYSVPIFTGKDEGKLYIELCNPIYHLIGSDVTIELSVAHSV